MSTYEYISIGLNILLLLGIYLAYRQLVESRRATKAQVLLRLHEEWRDPEIYKAVGYIHDIRDEWKKHPLSKWDDLANEWVEATFKKEPQKWLARRTASQFLAKMGYLVKSGHLTPDEFFGVVPEAGRLLIVLIPIELAIIKHMAKIQGESVEEWDRAFGKWEFNFLWSAYKQWYKNNRESYELQPINWRQLL